MLNKMSWLSDIVSGLGDALNWVLDSVLFFLPPSPFQAAISGLYQNEFISNIFGYINYLIPLSEIIGIMSIWLTAIGVYYLYMTILRWAKAIN